MRAEEIDHRPREQDGAADPVEHEVLLHVRVGGDPSVVKEPQAETEEAYGEKIWTDLGRGWLLVGHGSSSDVDRVNPHGATLWKLGCF